MKKLIILLSIVALTFAQMPTSEALFLDIHSSLSNRLPMQNPAYLNSETSPYNYAFSYSYLNAAGDHKLPFTPNAKNYHTIEISAFQEMDGGLYFGGRFAYRNEERLGKLWLHNAETNVNVPFFFGDSSSGDFNLNGIDWNIIFSYPISKNARIALDVFYNVDEQFKSVFPKPNSKRNDLHLKPAIALDKDNFRLGLRGSYFNYKEEIETKKYSLEPNRTPIFMRIRGLDRPLLSYAETTEERLQNIIGYGGAMDICVDNILSLEANIEKAEALITDGGAYPVEQGNWGYLRFNYRGNLFLNILDDFQADLFFLQENNAAKGNHPTMEAQIFNMATRHFEGGLGIAYKPSSQDEWKAIASYAFEDLLREDTFLGLSHYIPSEILSIGLKAELRRAATSLTFDLAYEYNNRGDLTEYNELSAWYYQMITEKEIIFYGRDTGSIIAGARVTFPYQNLIFAISGNYRNVSAINTNDRYRNAILKLEMIF
ncbi:MAG: DUF6850 family outer membrane beta-barrel protein [Candidatus Neomarinimicrobiota bacterium]